MGGYSTDRTLILNGSGSTAWNMAETSACRWGSSDCTLQADVWEGWAATTYSFHDPDDTPWIDGTPGTTDYDTLHSASGYWCYINSVAGMWDSVSKAEMVVSGGTYHLRVTSTSATGDRPRAAAACIPIPQFPQ
jgi:hypothetical protein